MLELVKGNFNSGKTGYLIDTMTKYKNNLYITNDESVAYIQKKMAEMHVCGACVGVHSLHTFLSAESGVPAERIITKEEGLLVFAQIIDDNRDNLEVLKDVPVNSSDIPQIYDIVSTLVETEVSPASFRNVLPDDVAGKKSIDSKLSDIIKIANADKPIMRDIVLLYEKYIERLEKEMRVCSPEKALKRASAAIFSNPSCLMYDNIIIDSLDYYPTIMTELMLTYADRKNVDMHVAVLTGDSLQESNASHSHRVAKGILETVRRIHLTSHCLAYHEMTGNNAKGGIATISKVFFGGQTITRTDYSSEGLCFFEADDPVAEAAVVAGHIADAIKNGYDASDIVVTASDFSVYSEPLERALKNEKIAYTYHDKTTLKDTDIYTFINIIAEAAQRGELVGDDISRLVQIPFFNANPEEISAVVSFVERFGNNITEAHANSAAFNTKRDHKAASSVILKAMNRINPLKDKMSAETFEDAVVALYEIIKAVGINDHYTHIAEEYQNNGDTQQALNIVNMWEKLCDALETIRRIYGNRPCSGEQFIRVIDRIFADTKIVASEDYFGQISILPLTSAKNKRNKITFILGANEGSFPGKIKPHMLSDMTRKNLNGKSPFPQFLLDIDVELKDMSDIYMTMIKPTEKLYISYAKTDMTGAIQYWASCIKNILKACGINNNTLPLTEEQRFSRLVYSMFEYRWTSVKADTLDEDFAYFKENENYSVRLAKVVEECCTDRTRINASTQKILSAYKTLETMPVTELEAYANCPFSHYISYALRPRQSHRFEESPADVGNFYHDVLKKYFDRINGVDLAAITEEQCRNDVEQICETVCTTHNDNILDTTVAFKYQKSLMIRQVVKAAWNLLLQLRKGSFRVYKTETKIEEDNAIVLKTADGTEIRLTGKIDRIDTAVVDGKEYARVIDYKSGKKKYDEELVSAGLQLQLPLYLGAIPFESAGMYYATVATPIKDCDTREDESRKYLLSGLTLSDHAVAYATDHVLCDSDVKSDVVNVATLKSGEFSKRSSVTTNFEEVKDKAVAVATDIASQILHGQTKAHPYKTQKMNACQYCPHKNACNFDPLMPENSYRKI